MNSAVSVIVISAANVNDFTNLYYFCYLHVCMTQSGNLQTPIKKLYNHLKKIMNMLINFGLFESH